MPTEKDTIKCESTFNEDRTHRFLWKRVWNKDKPLYAVIMLNPASADNIITDNTTALVVNNVAAFDDAGGVVILNLYSKLIPKLNFRWNSDADLNSPENNGYIQKVASECSKVILAWGKSVDTNQRIAARADEVVKLLLLYKDKLFCISDGERVNLHPLTPALRHQWILKPYIHSIKESEQK